MSLSSHPPLSLSYTFYKILPLLIQFTSRVSIPAATQHSFFLLSPSPSLSHSLTRLNTMKVCIPFAFVSYVEVQGDGFVDSFYFFTLYPLSLSLSLSLRFASIAILFYKVLSLSLFYLSLPLSLCLFSLSVCQMEEEQALNEK